MGWEWKKTSTKIIRPVDSYSPVRFVYVIRLLYLTVKKPFYGSDNISLSSPSWPQIKLPITQINFTVPIMMETEAGSHFLTCIGITNLS